jgi:hypothetical protein
MAHFAYEWDPELFSTEGWVQDHWRNNWDLGKAERLLEEVVWTNN